MRSRWGILAILFALRATMALQFQSVAAVAPLLGSEFGVSLADIGALIGLYFAPGVALALPGGAVGQRFGDKATMFGALLLMLAGSVVMAFAASWSLQIAGRLVTGAGGVVFAILMVALPRGGAVVLTVAALGLVSGLPAGPIISLPARVLQPQTRAIGMGYTLYYAAMMPGPVIAGACAKWTGSAAAAFDFGALMILACLLILWGCNRIPAAMPKRA